MPKKDTLKKKTRKNQKTYRIYIKKNKINKKTRLKVTQHERMCFIKVNELKLTQRDILIFSLYVCCC